MPQSSPSKRHTLAELADLVGARLIGDGQVEVDGIAPIDEAGPSQLTFVANPRYLKELSGTRAAGVLVAGEHAGLSAAQLVVDSPYAAYARLMTLFYTVPRKAAGVSPDARVDPSAKVGAEPDIAPFATVGSGAILGDRVTLHAGARVGEGVVVGDDVTLHPNVVLYPGCRIGNRVIIHAGTVVGSDGFGYATDKGVHHKIPHVGGVVVGDDVEIGACCTIDRGVLGDTEIGAGSKLDNLIQVAHNVRVGKGCLLAAQTGIAGSTRLGDYVATGGQAGFSGHLSVGSRVQVAGKSGVTKDVADGKVVSGFPALPHREALKAQAAQARIPELRERVKRLEQNAGPKD